MTVRARERSRSHPLVPAEGGGSGEVSIPACLVFQRHLIPRLRYVGRIVFESDISLRRIRRVEFRGNSHKEYYRSVQPPPPANSLSPSVSVFSYLPFLILGLPFSLVHRPGFFSSASRSFPCTLFPRYRDTLF